jgi:hypothetical protein
MNNKPYTQIKLSENEVIREFSQNVDNSEMVWHRDREDREVEPVGKTDWMYQLDNQIPKIIEGKIFIPKETFHRVIKGTDDLKVKIRFLN